MLTAYSSAAAATGLRPRGFAGAFAAGFAGVFAAGFAGVFAAGFFAAGAFAAGFAGVFAAGFAGVFAAGFAGFCCWLCRSFCCWLCRSLSALCCGCCCGCWSGLLCRSLCCWGLFCCSHFLYPIKKTAGEILRTLKAESLALLVITIYNKYRRYAEQELFNSRIHCDCNDCGISLSNFRSENRIKTQRIKILVCQQRNTFKLTFAICELVQASH